jgi:hypothetical protein
MKNKVFITGLVLLTAVFFASCEDATGSTGPENYTAIDKFVAIAWGSGHTAWSADGETWTFGGRLPAEAASGGGVEAVQWSGIASGKGKFVAVAQDGKAAYSADGITWTETEMPNDSHWSNVAYGMGKFVAVTIYSNETAYSDDGVTWHEAGNLPGSAAWDSIAYGNGYFVTIDRDGNKAAWSDDGGNTWSAASLPEGKYNWYSITWGNGKFITLSDSVNAAAYSLDDGKNWIKTPNVLSGQCSVTYGGGVYAAVSGGNSSSTQAAWSSDGQTWTAVTLPDDARWQSIVWGGGKFVAVAQNNTGKAVWSADGKTWTAAALPELQEGATWSSIAFMPGY